MQVYIYWSAFPTDRWAAQALVYGLYLTETAQSVLLTHDAFQTFALGFMSPDALDDLHKLWLDVYLYDGLVATCVQIYYAHRIYILLSRAKTIPGIIVTLCVIQLVTNIFTSLSMKKIGRLSGYTQIKTPISGLLCNACTILADVLIAVTMVYALSRFDVRFTETRSLVRRLNRLAMETGSLLALTALSQPVLWFACPGRIYYFVPCLVLSKVYSNSLLALFNSRVRIHSVKGPGRYDRTNDTGSSGSASAVASYSTAVVNSGARVTSTFLGSDITDSFGLPTDILDSKPDSRAAEAHSSHHVTFDDHERSIP
uniref:DUF6534 domain-containing protein n=1 Tax=Moniliophthora roreri TaxID=221103 RepID=A0A0W0F2R7_MONRR